MISRYHLRVLTLLITLAAKCPADTVPSASPASAPKLDQPRAGTAVVSGHSVETNWPVRVKLFDGAGNIVQQRDVLVAASDSSIVVGFTVNLQAGQIVQAYFLNNGAEVMPSAPVSVVAETVAAEKQAIASLRDTQSPPPVSSSGPTIDPSDLGRARYYFTSGVVLSNNQGFQLPSSATQAGLFLGLNADRTWASLNSDGFRWWNVNTYLDARLTSVATQQQSASGTSTQSLTQSQKAAALQAGVYVPFIFGSPWHSDGNRYSLFLAPLANAGFVTLTDDQSATSAATPITDRFFKSYSYGTRLGVFQHFSSPDAAPQIVSYVDMTVGRYGDFEAFRAIAPLDLLSVRPWRYSFEGMLKLPHSPFLLGFDANIGTGAGVPHLFTPPLDDLRFILGTQFDFSKFLKSLQSL